MLCPNVYETKVEIRLGNLTGGFVLADKHEEHQNRPNKLHKVIKTLAGTHSETVPPNVFH